MYFYITFFSSKRKLAYLAPVTVINTVTGQTLSRSYGRYIAEFLNEDSLVHLGLLDLSTCVGLRYGRRYTRVRKLFWSALSYESVPKGTFYSSA